MSTRTIIENGLLMAWLFISAILGVGMLLSAFIPVKTLYEISNMLTLPHHGQHCSMCGMTHAFVALYHGDLNGALLHNDKSALLFSLLLINETLALVPLSRAARSLIPPLGRVNHEQR